VKRSKLLDPAMGDITSSYQDTTAAPQAALPAPVVATAASPTPLTPPPPPPLLFPNPEPSAIDNRVHLSVYSASPASPPSLIGGGSGRAGVGVASDTDTVAVGLFDVLVQQAGLLPVAAGSGATSDSNVTGSSSNDCGSGSYCDNWSGFDFESTFESIFGNLGGDLVDLQPWASGTARE